MNLAGNLNSVLMIQFLNLEGLIENNKKNQTNIPPPLEVMIEIQIYRS
jgi:hypothetical protein